MRLTRYLVVCLSLFFVGSATSPGGVQADVHRSVFVSSTGLGALYRINLATGVETAIIPVGSLASPEGLACGPDGRVYITESALLQNGVGRKISRVNQDGTDYTVVLDFATTPELASSGGPEGVNVKEESPGTSGLMFFNTRANGPLFPHTGSWSATRTGNNPRQVLLPFAGSTGNGEGTDFLISGLFNRNFLTVDFPNNRVLRAAPPFSQPQTGTVFISGLTGPNGISVNPLTGNVYVAEDFTGLIKIFTDTGVPTGAPLATGTVIRKIDFDEDGNLYVATVPGPVLRFGPAGGTPSVIGTVTDGNGVAVCKTADNG